MLMCGKVIYKLEKRQPIITKMKVINISLSLLTFASISDIFITSQVRNI